MEVMWVFFLEGAGSVGLPLSTAQPLGSLVTQHCPLERSEEAMQGRSSDLATGNWMSPCLLLPRWVPRANN